MPSPDSTGLPSAEQPDLAAIDLNTQLLDNYVAAETALEQGDEGTCLSMLESSLSIIEKGEERAVDTQFTADTLKLLGDVLFRQHRFEEASHFYSRCSDFCLDPDVPRGLAIDTFSKLGQCFLEFNDFTAAIDAFSHAIRLQNGDPDGRANRIQLLLLMARSHGEAGNSDREFRLFRKACTEAHEIKLPYVEIGALHSVAQHYLAAATKTGDRTLQHDRCLEIAESNLTAAATLYPALIGEQYRERMREQYTLSAALNRFRGKDQESNRLLEQAVDLIDTESAECIRELMQISREAHDETPPELALRIGEMLVAATDRFTPAVMEKRIYARAFLGQYLESLGDHERLKELAEEVVEHLEPNCQQCNPVHLAIFRNLLGRLYLQEEQLAEALPHLEACVEFLRLSPEIQVSDRMAYEIDRIDVSRALGDYDRACGLLESLETEIVGARYETPEHMIRDLAMVAIGFINIENLDAAHRVFASMSTLTADRAREQNAAIDPEILTDVYMIDAVLSYVQGDSSAGAGLVGLARAQSQAHMLSDEASSDVRFLLSYARGHGKTEALPFTAALYQLALSEFDVPDRHTRFSILFQLGASEFKAGNFEEAVGYHRSALDEINLLLQGTSDESEHSVHQSNRSSAQFAYARALHYLGDYPAAAEEYVKNVSHCMELGDLQDAIVASKKAAVVLTRLGRFKQARQVLDDLIHATGEYLGPESEAIAALLDSKADVLRAEHLIPQANHCQDTANKIWAASQFEGIEVYEVEIPEQDDSEFVDYLQSELEQIDSAYGEDSLFAIDRRKRALEQLQDRKLYQEMYELAVHTLSLLEDYLPPDHPETAFIYLHAGLGALMTGLSDDGLGYLRSGVRIARERLDKQHPLVAHCYFYLAQHEPNKLDGVGLLDAAIEIFSAAFSEYYPTIAQALRLQAGYYEDILDATKKADELRAKADRIDRMNRAEFEF